MAAPNTSNRDTGQGTTAVNRVGRVAPKTPVSGLVTFHNTFSERVSDRSDRAEKYIPHQGTAERGQPMDWPSKIKGLRSAVDMTQTAFANALDVARSLLALCEGGRRAPSTDLLVRLGNVAAEHQQPETAEWFWRAAGVKGIPKYRHPRTGEKRRARHPLRIDRLSQDVKDVIIKARAAGESWEHIAAIASAAAGQKLPRTSVQRWHDLRIEQQTTGEALREVIELLKSILSAVQK